MKIPAQQLIVPAQWTSIDFVADVHLQPSKDKTLKCWEEFLERSTADAIIVLGDLFEAWVGDDALEDTGSFESHCVAALRRASDLRPIYFMVGNRDFLVGEKFFRASRLLPLDDPTLLIWGERRIVLSHGDALCLGDVQYQEFRRLSRTKEWQRDLLSLPLHQRRALAQEIRAESQQRKDSGAMSYADADTDLVHIWLQECDSKLLIHGHTHRPNEHYLENACARIVLSDWDCDCTAQSESVRAEVLRFSSCGAWQRVDVAHRR